MKINHREALRVFGLTGSATFEEIKLAYRKACSHYHPDRNAAGLEMMKIVNAAWQSLSDYVAGSVTDLGDDLNLGDELNAALNAIIGLGLTIEICGSWIWVSGDTRPHREALKAASYKWAPKKMMWHYSPSGKKTWSRGNWDMDKIRATHGSVTVKGQQYARLAS